ncbi:MAG: biotin transporter BioY [Oscillospiraceae bacterium]
MKTKNMVFTALFAALICVMSPFSIPVGPIPISLATLAIYMTAAVLKPKQSVMAVFVYILLGAFGIPVFAGWTGGFAKVAGVTGGYIIGYLPCALAIGFLIDKNSNKKWIYPLSMAVGTILLYAVGTVWFMMQTNNSLTASLAICVVPFLTGDVIKIVTASIIAPTVRRAVERYSLAAAAQ